jgi:hypothetical protein
MGGTFSLVHGKMWGAYSSMIRHYGILKIAVSVGLLLRLLLTWVVPAGSYACKLWSVSDIPTWASGRSKKSLEASSRTMLGRVVGKKVKNDILLTELGLHPITHQ